MPEVYHELMGEPGRVLSYTPEDSALGNKCKTDRPLAAYDSDFKAAVDFLTRHEACTGRVGVAGVCLGGGLAVRAALASINPGVAALAAWYATDLHKANLSSDGDDTLARVAAGELGPARATPLEAILFYGRQDPHIPPEGRAAQKAAFEKGETNMTWVEVNGAHAFLRDENSFGRYNPELAAMTYDWMIRVFNRVLKA